MRKPSLPGFPLRRTLRSVLLAGVYASLSVASAHAATVYVQLGKAESVADAQETWKNLQIAYEKPLEGLQLFTPKSRNINDGNGVLRLQVGPVESKMRAQHICGELLAKGQECFIVERAQPLRAGVEVDKKPEPVRVVQETPPEPASVVEMPVTDGAAEESSSGIGGFFSGITVSLPWEEQRKAAQENPASILVTNKSEKQLSKKSKQQAKAAKEVVAEAVPKPEEKQAEALPVLHAEAPAVETPAAEVPAPEKKEGFFSSLFGSSESPPPPTPSPLSPVSASEEMVQKPVESLAAEPAPRPMELKPVENAAPIVSAPPPPPPVPAPFQLAAPSAPAPASVPPPAPPPMVIAPPKAVEVAPPAADPALPAGRVEVAEAIPVPLSGSGSGASSRIVIKQVPGFQEAPSPQLESLEQKPGMNAWMQVGQFGSEGEANAFWDVFRAQQPNANGWRMQLSKPYLSSNQPEVSLRVGPVRDVALAEALCSFAQHYNGLRLSCGTIEEMKERRSGESMPVAGMHTDRDYASRRAVFPSRASMLPRHSDVAGTSASAASADSPFGMSSEDGNSWIQFGTYPTETKAQDAWKALELRNKGALKGYFPAINSPSQGKQVYRLRMGPFKNEAEAELMCNRLNTGGASCTVVPGG